MGEAIEAVQEQIAQLLSEAGAALRGLGGVAIFPIAYADAEHWEALRRAMESTTR